MSEAWAEAARQRASDLVEGLPGGWARMLFRRVVLVQDAADLGVALCLACAGAEVELVCGSAPEWSDPEDTHRVECLRRLLAASEPRLDLSPIASIGRDNFLSATRLRITEAAHPAWGEHVDGTVDIWIVDAASVLGNDPEAFLRSLHAVSPEGALVQIVAAPGEVWDAPRCDGVARAALEVGFGIGWTASGARKAGEAKGRVLGVGLIRLDGPMREFPIEAREGPMLLAHCHARYDIACQLVNDAEVLDAGGGTGIGGRRMLDAGAQAVVSLDASAEAIAVAESLGETPGLRLRRWDLDTTPLPFDDESFDVVTCLEALEHIRHPEAALAEFERILRPGGLLLVTVPDAEFEGRWAQVNGFDNPFHPSVPPRQVFEGWLSRFSQVRWLRQVDVVGSWVLEEGSGSAPTSHIVAEREWSVAQGPAQVLAAVCVRAGAPARAVPQRLSSALRVWQNQPSASLPRHERERELEAQILAQRFHWWTERNAAAAEAEAARGQVSSLGTAAQDERAARLRVEGERDAVRAELDHAREHLARAGLQGALEELDRRCLEIESRVYDLEGDALDLAKAEPPGAADTRPSDALALENEALETSDPDPEANS